MSHVGLITLPTEVARDSWLGIAQRIYAAAFSNGPAAVIVFFVISGLCIHYPNVGGRDFQVGAFYGQRFLRILPPMLVAILVGGLMGADGFRVSRETWQLPSFLWSLVAELIYYAIYPVLRGLANRWGWQRLLLVAYLGASSVMVLHPTTKGMPDYGYHLTWLVGLPCWLLGCVLGEHVARPLPAGTSAGSVRGLRVAMFALNVISWQTLFSARPYLPPNAFIVALQVVGVGAYFWLKAEIRHFRAATPSRLLESAGAWSYSLYLFHELGFSAWARWVPAPLHSAGEVLWAMCRPLAVLGFCYAFFLAVEAPTHRLAQTVGKRLRGRRAGPGASHPPSSV